jgi:surface polysaccharide O-acyltransferase-like enzyme
MTSEDKRRYDFDAIRVFAILTIFFFHCARFFDPFSWHLKNAETSIIVAAFVGFVDIWAIPLFFLISGVGTWYALNTRTPGQYLSERIKRLLIPLFTVGAFLLLPPQYYFEITTNSDFTGSFLESYGLYFAHIFVDNGPIAFFCTPWSGHLWFLQQLFLVSLFTLPLLIYLRSDPGQAKVHRLAAICDRTGGLFLLVIPIAVLYVCLQWIPQQDDHGWPNFFSYLVFFLIGYIIPMDKRFSETIRRSGWIALLSAIVTYLVLVFIYINFEEILITPSISWLYICVQLVRSLCSLSWIVFFLSMFAKYFSNKSKTVVYGNEALLPFYILHQTIIILVGQFIIPLKLSIPVKYTIISIISFVIIIALYEFLVKRINVLRFLFGMRPKR